MRGKRSQLISLLFLFFLVLFSCKESEDGLGLDIIPSEDGLNTFKQDSFTIVAYTRLVDSLRTDELTSNLLGAYTDEYFGLTKAGIYSQILLSANDVDFGNEGQLVVDSLVLTLAYNGDFYGELNSQTVGVYEVLEEISRDSAFYSNQSKPINYNLVEVGSGSYTPNLFLGVAVGDDTLSPHVRIRLKPELGQRFLNESGNTSFSDNENFLEFFKGLHIATLNTSGGIVNFNLESNLSGLTMYYRDETVGEEDTLTFDFDISSLAGRYTHFQHDYSLASNPALNNQLSDSTLGDDLLFLQAGGGTEIHLNFPFLESLNDIEENLIINQAELVLPITKGTGNVNLAPQEKLFIIQVADTDGDGVEDETEFIPDQFLGDTHIDGNLDLIDGEYRIKITSLVQQILNGSVPKKKLILVSSQGGVSVNRVIFNGAKSLDADKTRLEITYTVY